MDGAGFLSRSREGVRGINGKKRRRLGRVSLTLPLDPGTERRVFLFFPAWCLWFWLPRLMRSLLPCWKPLSCLPVCQVCPLYIYLPRTVTPVLLCLSPSGPPDSQWRLWGMIHETLLRGRGTGGPDALAEKVPSKDLLPLLVSLCSGCTHKAEGVFIVIPHGSRLHPLPSPSIWMSSPRLGVEEEVFPAMVSFIVSPNKKSLKKSSQDKMGVHVRAH